MRSRDEIRAFIVARLAQELGVPAPSIPTDAPLASFGLDSLGALELAVDLERLVGREIPRTAFLDHPTIDALSAFVARDPSAPAALGEVEPTPPAARSSSDDGVAIVGVGVRLPGARSLSELASLLEREEIRIDVLDDEVEGSGPRAAARHLARLEDRTAFDAWFFGIPPAEAARMDPQQRVLLEVSHWALEDAGLARGALAGRPVGVFVGASHSDHALRALSDRERIDAYTGTGAALSVLANRVSHALGVTGPSFTVDTACSSSLVALHLARTALLRGECELALVAGVSLVLGAEASLAFAEIGLLSADGACRPFGEDAAGYRRGDGCVVLVLARGGVARGLGLRPRARVLASSIDHAGRTNGLLAPSAASQERLLARCLAEAGADADGVDYVEAHGTGTPLGDEVEALALSAAYRSAAREAARPLRIGSLKATFGHLEAAAGVASIAKVLAAMHGGAYLPTPGVARPRALPSGLALQRDREPWAPRDGAARRAAVSSFGFGGAGAHVLLEHVASSAPRVEAVTDRREPRVLAFSARSAGALERMVREAAAVLARDPSEQTLAALASTLARRDRFVEHRAACAVLGASDALDVLGSRPAARFFTAAGVPRTPRVAFLFAGIGDPLRGCAAALCEGEPELAAHVDELARAVLAAGGPDVRPWLCERGADDGRARLRSSRERDDAGTLVPTAVLHPALFVLEHALAMRWKRLGVRPDVVLGQSLGEIAAALAAGIVEEEAALVMVTRRAALFEAVPEGRMVALAADEETALAMAGPGVVVAGRNGRDGVVLAGPADAIDALCERALREDVALRRLVARHPFHTPALESVAAGAEASLLPRAALSPPVVPFVSGLDARELSGAECCDPAYWTSHVHRRLETARALAYLVERHAPDVVIEIGPAASLARLLVRNLADARRAPRVVPSSGGPLEALARGFVAGLPVELPGSDARIELPYPFERTDYPLAPRGAGAPRSGLSRLVERRGGARVVASEPAPAALEVDGALDGPAIERALAFLTDASEPRVLVVREGESAARGLAALAGCARAEGSERALRVVHASRDVPIAQAAALALRAAPDVALRCERGLRGVSIHEALFAPEPAARREPLDGLRVAVLGTGALGTRIAGVLEREGARVVRWARRGSARIDLDQAPGELDWIVSTLGPSATRSLVVLRETSASLVLDAIADRARLIESLEALTERAPVVVVSSVAAFLGGAGLAPYAAAHAAVDLARAEAGSPLGWAFWDHRASDAALLDLLLAVRDAGPGAALAWRTSDEGAHATRALAERPPTPYRAPEGEVEAAVAAILAELLGFERIGRDDDFFALGGTSLVAMRALRALRSRFGVELPISELLRAPTLEGIALAVEEALVESVRAEAGE